MISECEKAVGTYLGPGPATIILDIRGQDSVRATRYVAQKKAETKRRIAEIFQRKRRIASDIYHREVADLLFPSLITKWNDILLKAIEIDPEVVTNTNNLGKLFYLLMQLGKLAKRGGGW